jgi:hypothetical protein
MRRTLSKYQPVARQSEKQAQRASQQLTLLEELKTVAGRLGFEVREEKLLREVGYHVRSGSCRVRESHVILLDRNLPVTGQIDVLAEELAKHPLDGIYLSPAARQLLETAAPCEKAPGASAAQAAPSTAEPPPAAAATPPDRQ